MQTHRIASYCMSATSSTVEYNSNDIDSITPEKDCMNSRSSITGSRDSNLVNMKNTCRNSNNNVELYSNSSSTCSYTTNTPSSYISNSPTMSITDNKMDNTTISEYQNQVNSEVEDYSSSASDYNKNISKMKKPFNSKHERCLSDGEHRCKKKGVVKKCMDEIEDKIPKMLNRNISNSDKTITPNREYFEKDFKKLSLDEKNLGNKKELSPPLFRFFKHPKHYIPIAKSTISGKIKNSTASGFVPSKEYVKSELAAIERYFMKCFEMRSKEKRTSWLKKYKDKFKVFCKDIVERTYEDYITESWHEDDISRGDGFRAIYWGRRSIDRRIYMASEKADLPLSIIFKIIPFSGTMVINPKSIYVHENLDVQPIVIFSGDFVNFIVSDLVDDSNPHYCSNQHGSVEYDSGNSPLSESHIVAQLSAHAKNVDTKNKLSYLKLVKPHKDAIALAKKKNNNVSDTEFEFQRRLDEGDVCRRYRKPYKASTPTNDGGVVKIGKDRSNKSKNDFFNRSYNFKPQVAANNIKCNMKPDMNFPDGRHNVHYQTEEYYQFMPNYGFNEYMIPEAGNGFNVQFEMCPPMMRDSNGFTSVPFMSQNQFAGDKNSESLNFYVQPQHNQFANQNFNPNFMYNNSNQMNSSYDQIMDSYYPPYHMNEMELQNPMMQPIDTVNPNNFILDPMHDNFPGMFSNNSMHNPNIMPHQFINPMSVNNVIVSNPHPKTDNPLVIKKKSCAQSDEQDTNDNQNTVVVVT